MHESSLSLLSVARCTQDQSDGCRDTQGLCAAPNPTHQIHILLHWLWMYATKILGLGARDIQLWADCDPGACLDAGAALPDCVLHPCMGPYGRGLAEALFSRPSWCVCALSCTCELQAARCRLYEPAFTCMVDLSKPWPAAGRRSMPSVSSCLSVCPPVQAAPAAGACGV